MQNNFNCIYMIRNMINGLIYIGQAENMKNRWAKHKRDSKLKNITRMPISKAICEFGEDNFEYIVLEEDIDKEYMSERELHYIKLYRSHESSIGYNVAMKHAVGYKYKTMDYKYDPKFIPKIIECLKNKVDRLEIEALYKIARTTLNDIIYKRTHKELTLNIDMSHYIKRKVLTIEEATALCIDHKYNKMDIAELSEKYGVGGTNIHRIIKGKIRPGLYDSI